MQGLLSASSGKVMSNVPWEKVFSLTWMDGVKFAVSALVIVLATKIQLFHDRLSALLIALPLTSLIAMIWMRAEDSRPAAQANERIANHAEGTFWFVLPTLPMFLVFPWMLRHGWSFGWSLLLNCILTIALFLLLLWVRRAMGKPLL